ncbi:hypothetical protein FACS189450_08360 [Spirochaetia bacterium]|nr:hypothetical protein FACS189450_08360 [Spirochaetia bacterium]
MKQRLVLRTMFSMTLTLGLILGGCASNQQTSSQDVKNIPYSELFGMPLNTLKSRLSPLMLEKLGDDIYMCSGYPKDAVSLFSIDSKVGVYSWSELYIFSDSYYKTLVDEFTKAFGTPQEDEDGGFYWTENLISAISVLLVYRWNDDEVDKLVIERHGFNYPEN